MRTRTALLQGVPGKYEIVDVDIEEPRQGELLLDVAAAGLCHTDDHVAKGDMPVGIHPWAGGHEGAGTVLQVGPDTPGWTEGDIVIFSCTGPMCGRCRWCASGHGNLCDAVAAALNGDRWNDPGSYRMTFEGAPVGQMCGVSTFAEQTTVAVESCLKVEDDISLEVLGVLGCSVGTGWGSAVNCANTRPGDVIIVMGIGGIGINAVQGAAHTRAGHIIAVDPVPFKLEKAREFGATSTFATIEEADDFARSVTNGQGADATIVTVGVTTGEHIAQAYATIRKMGTLVVTGLGDLTAVGAPIPWGDLVLSQKRIQGNIYGACNPAQDIPHQLRMYQQGLLKVDELITTRYSLENINDAYADLHAGKNLRGLVVHG